MFNIDTKVTFMSRTFIWKLSNRLSPFYVWSHGLSYKSRHNLSPDSGFPDTLEFNIYSFQMKIKVNVYKAHNFLFLTVRKMHMRKLNSSKNGETESLNNV